MLSKNPRNTGQTCSLLELTVLHSLGDLSKAFATVHDKVRLNKVTFHVSWQSSCCYCQVCQIKFSNVYYGVPRGSILGSPAIYSRRNLCLCVFVGYCWPAMYNSDIVICIFRPLCKWIAYMYFCLQAHLPRMVPWRTNKVFSIIDIYFLSVAMTFFLLKIPPGKPSALKWSNLTKMTNYWKF